MSKPRRREKGPVLRFRARAYCRTCDQPAGQWHIGLDETPVLAAVQPDVERHTVPARSGGYHEVYCQSGWGSRCRRCQHWRSPLVRERRAAVAALAEHERSQEHLDYVPPLAERRAAEQREIAERIANLIEGI